MVYSASRLTEFLACRHLARVGKVAQGPGKSDDLLVARLGDEHEKAHLRRLKEAGLSVHEFDDSPSAIHEIDKQVAETLAAMQSGVDVIFQGWVGDRHSAGRTDFLRRVETPSDLGGWSYEVEDTKLAKSPKPSAVIQLCFYSSHLGVLQGKAPTEMHLVLGDNRRESLLLGDFADYYGALVQQYELFLDAETETYPWPCSHCQICPNASTCEEQRSEDDHLSVVAGITRGQAERLQSAEVATIAELAEIEHLPNVRIGDETLVRLQRQARLQHSERSGGGHSYELLEPAIDPEEPAKSRNLGLFALPEPDPGDLFYDIEGYPHAGDGMLDYLHGFWSRDGEFKAFWAHSYAEEKTAFEAVIDYITARRAQYPGMHVYHYAPYERTAFGRMMGRHGTRESEVDDLFRSGTLVDLYAAVRNGVAVSQPSYSLKHLEALYGFEREEHDLIRGDASIEAYHDAMTADDEAERDRLLQLIENYNHDDCHSTLRLHDWLMELRSEAVGRFGDHRVAAAEASEVSTEQEEAEAKAAAITEALLTGIPDDPAEHTPEQRALYLLAHMQSWHRREAKPEWWAYFARVEAFNTADWQRLTDDTETLTGLTWKHSQPPTGKARTWTHTYRFDPAQDHRFAVGDQVVPLPSLNPDPDKSPPTVAIEAIDNLAGTLSFARGNTPISYVKVLIPQRPIGTAQHRDALNRLGQTTTSTGIDPNNPLNAEHAILTRATPRILDCVPCDPILPPTLDGDAVKASLADVISRLQHSYLPIQGPPGTGKTWGTAHAITQLAQQGHKIGICGPSHKVIANLAEWIGRAADNQGLGAHQLRVFQHSSDKADIAHHARVSKAGTKHTDIDATLTDPSVVVAGTSWLYAKTDYTKAFDVVFIDEAGQLSLADTLAVAQAAKNVVLVGDPQQLTQPIKGTHPPHVAVSALEHVLGARNTIAPHAGILLAETRRLHPDLCGWTSYRFYDGRLTAHSTTATQKIGGDDWLSGSGIRFLPVTHTGCRTRSRAEAEAVADICRQLIGRDLTDNKGQTRAVTPADIAVIAPYNAHCTELAATLPDGVNIGTVDRLQGLEAPVAIYTLAASDPDDIRRGHDFLYSPNRLNVATSRARTLAIVAASPALLTPYPTRIETMRNANHLANAATIGAEE